MGLPERLHRRLDVKTRVGNVINEDAIVTATELRKNGKLA